MSKYLVRYQTTLFYEVEVEAENADDARYEALELDLETDDMDTEVTLVRLIKEESNA